MKDLFQQSKRVHKIGEVYVTVNPTLYAKLLSLYQKNKDIYRKNPEKWEERLEHMNIGYSYNSPQEIKVSYFVV